MQDISELSYPLNDTLAWASEPVSGTASNLSCFIL